MDFNIDEIFEIAEQMERNGAKFYRAAAEAISDKEQQQQLIELALMEDEHERTFSGMRELLANVEKRESTYEGDESVKQYLWAWVDKKVFNPAADAGVVLANADDLPGILNFALDREKDAIVFYNGLKSGISSESDREKVDAIIREEMLHIGLLNRQLHRLRG